MRLVRRTLPLFLWGALVLLGCAEVRDPGAPTDRQLDALVQRRATRALVEKELGPSYTTYEKGKPSWDSLLSFLSQQPETYCRPVREATKKSPVIIFYTTMWQMTWIFFDEGGTMTGFYVTTQ